MRMKRKNHITRERAERLLNGRDGDASEIARVLDAASRPATSGELAREDATVAMFHRTRLEHPVPASRRETVRLSTFGRLAAGKALLAAIVALVFATAGVALVANDRVPWNQPPGHSARDDPDDSTEGTQGEDESTITEDPAEGEETEEDPAVESEESSEESAGESTEESTEVRGARGLCRAYFSGNKQDHGKSLESPAFTDLVETACGVDNVGAYCAEVLADHEAKTGKPEKTGEPENTGESENTGKPDEGDKKSLPGLRSKRRFAGTGRADAPAKLRIV